MESESYQVGDLIGVAVTSASPFRGMRGKVKQVDLNGDLLVEIDGENRLLFKDEVRLIYRPTPNIIIQTTI